MDKYTEEFPLDRFVNTANLEEVLYKFENERKLSDLPNYKKSYTLEEFMAEFPKSDEKNTILESNSKIVKEDEYFHDVSGNVISDR